MKHLLILGLVLLVACAKKKTEPLLNENIKDVLINYGSNNPETEVLIETKLGNIRIKLYEDTPLHRANFIKHIKEGYYDNADFYRIAYEFMIQGGDLNKKLPYRIPSEINAKYIHKRGALSMARVDENNPNLESSAAEFFIIHGGRYTEEDVELEVKNLGLTLTPEQKSMYATQGGYMTLDGKYTVFGEVVEGIEVIELIARSKVYNEDKPLRKIPFTISVVK